MSDKNQNQSGKGRDNQPDKIEKGERFDIYRNEHKGLPDLHDRSSGSANIDRSGKRGGDDITDHTGPMKNPTNQNED